ncbi:PLC-like phosphodiesterase [Ochromonadaceae sp. CCMP2298]|nr:PLC-like phosphodiesterase [Ochromonadaceae sp. CCMP2298]
MKFSITAALALEPSHRALLELAGHRGGMSGHNSFVPEHSKAAYALGASYGATYIEPDVISTKDGYLMVCHGNELGRTSDVADKPEYADRYTTKIINDGDGSINEETGWFSEDFTWAEISTLRLHATAHAVYPETKLSNYFASIGLPLEEKVVATLNTLCDLTTVMLVNGGAKGAAQISSMDKVTAISRYAQILSLPTSFDDVVFDAAVHMGKQAGMLCY